MVDTDALVAKNVIKKNTTLVKVLGDGDLTKKLNRPCRQGVRVCEGQD